MKKKLALLLLPVAILTGCASIPTEYKSPCACDYKPLNKQVEEDGKAVA